MHARIFVMMAVLAADPAPSVLAEIDVTKLPPASTKQGLTFDKDIKPLFEASCVNCHGERRQRAGLRLDSREAALQGSDEGKILEVGNSKDSLLVHAVSQLDDETAMPPKRGRGRGGFGFGGFGGPPGGGAGPGAPPGPGGPGGPDGRNAPGRPGGRGGFDFAAMMAGGLFAQADTDQNQKLTKAEFGGLAERWFNKIDTKKTGQLNQQEFSAGMDDVLPAMDPFGGGGARGFGAGRGPGGQRGGNEGMGFGLGRFLGPALFSAADSDTNGSLTRVELSTMFNNWFTTWDTNHTDALTVQQFRDGFAASMPRPAPFGGRGPGGPGGPGGFGGFGFGRTALAQQMVTQGDADKNGKLSKAEFMALADAWFDKIDAAKTGKVNQEQFSSKLAEALGLPAETSAPRAGDGNGGRRGPGPAGRSDAGPRPGGPGGPGGGPAALGPGIFGAADGDKDGALTRAELKATFEKWFTSFDTAKSGSLDNDSLYAGLREILPGGMPGGFGGGGFGFPGGRGGDSPPKPLTTEQVGLVRAWIDQGAK